MTCKIPAFCVSSSSLVAVRMRERSVIDTGTGPTPPTSHLFTAGNMMLKKAKLVSLDCWDTKRIFLVKTGHEMTKHMTILGRVQGPSLKPWVGI